MALKLSVIINAQNVESELPLALSSVKDLADEIVVIDQNSTDQTAAVAKKFGAKVYSHPSVHYVELARNFGISKTTGEWVLILDPDEEIEKNLKTKIKQIIKNPKADYYRIPRKNIIFGKLIKHALWWPDYQTRLFRKGKVSWSEIIHSVPITVGQGSDFPAEDEYAILHHNYGSIDQYLEKLGRYTTAQANHLVESKYKFKWQDLMVKPIKEFINRYFTGEGYKEGVHGLALSLLQAFSELVVYLKIWQEEKFQEQNLELNDVIGCMRSNERDLHYWQHDSLYKKNGKLINRIYRKLKI